MTLSACMICGEPSEQGRCPAHRLKAAPKRMTPQRLTRSRAAWINLSRRLRRMQDWCSVPGCTSTDLTVDHIVPLAKGGDPYALTNLQVLCRRHNAEKGDQTWGVGVDGSQVAPSAKAKSATLSTSRYRGV